MSDVLAAYPSRRMPSQNYCNTLRRIRCGQVGHKQSDGVRLGDHSGGRGGPRGPSEPRPYRLQAHARHSRLSTTQKYIHLAREQAALEAAAMWGDPVPQSCPQKPQKAENAATLAN
jgi:hypothetical protein